MGFASLCRLLRHARGDRDAWEQAALPRLIHLDIAAPFAPGAARIAVQVVFGLACALLMMALRWLLDMVAPTSGPFALVYPTVLLATLFGRWPAGLVAYVTAFVWAWYFALSFPRSFTFELPSDPARVVINAASCLIILLFAEFFRAEVRRRESELNASADRRLMLLAELEHRTKNNFALVASLLDIQKRRQSVPEAESAIEDAISRVRAFADAYSNLSLEQEEGAEVRMKPYLEQMIARISRGAMSDAVRIEHDIDPLTLSREEGVAIGLYLNEALTNCAKYAFADGREGTIEVRFVASGEAWQLTVRDDGMGDAAKSDPRGGLGSSLMNAFCAQANATHELTFGPHGCVAELRSRVDPV